MYRMLWLEPRRCGTLLGIALSLVSEKDVTETTTEALSLQLERVDQPKSERSVGTPTRLA